MAANERENVDWVQQAYEAFVVNAQDVEPTNPVKAVEAYFEKNASDELKARAKSEGKTAEKCWAFVEAVARKALSGRSGHIDPVVVYAIAMHWFEDVPADWNVRKKTQAERDADEKAAREAKEKAEKEARERAAREARENPLGIDAPRVEAPVAHQTRSTLPKPETRPVRSKRKQGFFFDVLDEKQEGGSDHD